MRTGGMTLLRGRIPAFVIVLWLALLALTTVTWMYDVTGLSVGMPMPVFFIVLGSPVIVALYLGWWQESLWDGLKVGVWGGTLFGLANMAGNLMLSAILIALDKVAPYQDIRWWEALVEVLEFALLFAIVGFVLGLVGGLVGAGAALTRHRGQEHPVG